MTVQSTGNQSLPVRRRGRTILIMAAIFVCGFVSGGAVSRVIVRQQILQALRNTDDPSNRIADLICSRLSLNSDQRSLVEPIVRERYRKMNAIRSQMVPMQVAEFEAMCLEVSGVLDQEHQAAIQTLASDLKSHYLPTVGAPPAELLFSRFDQNRDLVLTESEVPSGVWRRLKLVDSNDDAEVTVDEFQTVCQRLTLY